jgi:DNA-binding PadR family transcriptional regulator
MFTRDGQSAIIGRVPRATARDQLTTTEYALLGMLARYGEHSGYELLHLAQTGIGFFWSPAKSHVYAVLPRLESGDHARRRLIRQTGKPDKHLWRITARGRAALRAWINTIDADPLDNLGVLLLKLFFGDHGDIEPLIAHLERYRDQASEKLRQLRSIDEAQPDPPSARDRMPLITLRQGLAVLESLVRWAEEALDELRARPTAQAGHSVAGV